MSESLIHIEAFDCLPFPADKVNANVLQEFIQSQSGNKFWFTHNGREDDAPLAEFDYKTYGWNAGRFVGEADFEFNQQKYRITIKPRFGEKMLFRMLEEIFNIRITSSASQSSNKDQWKHFIKRIIAFIWLQKLANANLHGVPKVQQKREYKGQTIRGKLDVRRTIKSYYTNYEIVSVYREKNIDETIAQIIFQAYQILKKDFEIGKVNIPDSAQEAINQVHSTVKNIKHITEHDYQDIHYKEIYLSWKPIVDLSWDVIKRKQLSLKQDNRKNGFGFFIDMAEVWEQYLRVILRKNLSPLGWHYSNENQIAYKEKFYRRELIPDFVFKKENEVTIWDAKYKRMNGNYGDVDRSDFFQIHTYIQHFLNHKKVKSGGLLYPISDKQVNFENYASSFLMNEEGAKLNFVIDGMELKEQEEIQNNRQFESEFVSRIIKYIS